MRHEMIAATAATRLRYASARQALRASVPAILPLTRNTTMKRLLLTAATLAVLTTAANADDTLDKFHTFALSWAFDHECEKLPEQYRNKLLTNMNNAPKDKIDAALANVGAYVRREGRTAFCATFKDFMAEAFKS